MSNLTRSFAALADETRLRIVEHIAVSGEMPAGALAGISGVSAPAVSRHLKVLRDAGVLEQRAEGTHRYYSVRPAALGAISDWAQRHRAFWSSSLARLDAHLALVERGEDAS